MNPQVEVHEGHQRLRPAVPNKDRLRAMLHISSKVTSARFARVWYSVIHECSASERSSDTAVHELDFLEFCQVQLPLLLFPLLLLR